MNQINKPMASLVFLQQFSTVNMLKNRTKLHKPRARVPESLMTDGIDTRTSDLQIEAKKIEKKPTERAKKRLTL